MLRGIPDVLSPELLAILCGMGHADTIVLGDGNFPAAACAQQGGGRLVRADGIGVPALLDAILRLMPLDYAEKPVLLMEPDRPVQVPIWEEYEKIIAKYEPRGGAVTGRLERFAFYEAARRSFCVVQTGERAVYANIILAKGVVE